MDKPSSTCHVPLLPEGRQPVCDQTDVPACAAVVTCSLAATVLPFDEPASVRHLYWSSRELAGRSGRRGTRLIDCMEAWSKWGLVAESRWPWEKDGVEERPPESVLAVQHSRFRPEIRRADERERLPTEGEGLVQELRALVSRGKPFSLEFPLHPAQFPGFSDGHLPALSADQAAFGHHVVLVTGFSDTQECRHEPRTVGAFRFQNSWGAEWGEGGTGWLPYEYALTGRVRDVWVVYPLGEIPRNGTVPCEAERPQVVRLD
ncbi:C1 family peptidase [Streptomyces sp. NPDC059452]|uniref:C1 family peptidase n=1 Tax=Streptomyces sp. NPDC059452 TaxID=3346835 RepID=UPI0036B5C1A1